MRAITLCTPADQLEWDALTLRKNSLTLELRDIETLLTNLAAKTFEHLLRTGEWKVTSYGGGDKVVPGNKDAEDQVETIISTALKLGYHDQFTVSDGRVKIYGRVDDGDLTLDMYPKRIMDGPSAEETAAAFHELNVTVDLTEWAEKLRQRHLEKAKRELAAAQRNVQRLAAKEPE
jgi:hypothetical protein